MGFLDKIFKGARSKEKEEEVATKAPCLHVALAPRWDSAADMGNPDKVSGFKCDACDEEFTPAEASALRRTETDRLKTELDMDAARKA